MKLLRAFLICLALSYAALATPPPAPPPIDVMFDEFARFMPDKFEYWRKFIQIRIPRPSDEFAADLWDGLGVCSSHLKADCIPDIRRALAEKRKPEELAEEFDRLILTIDDFQWCVSELLIAGSAKKQITLEDSVLEELSGFFRALRQYRTRFGWTFRGEIKEAQKPNKAPEPTPPSVTPRASKSIPK